MQRCLRFALCALLFVVGCNPFAMPDTPARQVPGPNVPGPNVPGPNVPGPNVPSLNAPALTVQRGAQLAGKPAPIVQGPRIGERDVPLQAPFVGEDGFAPDGYPWKQADKVALLSLLRLQRFDELDRFFSFYQDAYEQDYHYEYWPDGAVSSFYTPDPALEPLLDAWVMHSPQSFAAHVSRGNYRCKLAWHYRGGKYAHKTSTAQFRTMDEYLAAARVDLNRSIELRPRLLAAYVRLLLASGSQADHDESDRVLGLATDLCPLCYLPRRALLSNLLPRWQGSYEQMDAFVEQTKPLWKQNPRLRFLLAEADLDRCDVAEEDDKRAAAHEYCHRALRGGDEPQALSEAARLFIQERRYAAALPLLDRALRVEPHCREALRQRLDARIGVDDLAGAARDALNARHLEPTNAHIAKQVLWLIAAIAKDSEELRKANKADEAATLLSLGLALSPNDPDLLQRVGNTVAPDALSPASMEAQLMAAPDDFDLRIRLDAALAARQRYADVVVMWDEFIVTHPTDPRSFSERGGAKWHLQLIDEAIADMQHACDLGMAKACADVPRMRARAGR